MSATYRVSEVAKAAGISGATVTKFLKNGSLKGEKIPSHTVPGGYFWQVNGQLDEVVAQLQRLSPIRRNVRTHAERARGAAATLPPNKDLFTAADVATLLGVTPGRVNVWVRDAKIETLRNGKFGYIRRADVEKLRELHTPKVKEEPVKAVKAAAVAPTVQTSIDTERLRAIEEKLNGLSAFMRRFAASIGYTE
jgi:hypothetical protein